MLHYVGTHFIQRMTVVLDKLGINLIPEERGLLEEPAAVILPFSIIFHTLLDSPSTETGNLTPISFVWHWIRHSFMVRVQTDSIVVLCISDWEDFYYLDEWAYGLEDAFGHSYLHAVLLQAGKNDEFANDIVEYVLSNGKDPRLLGSKSLRHDGFTLLAYAAATGLEQTFSFLLDRWVVDPQPSVEDAFTVPLRIIARTGNVNMIRHLLAVRDLRVTRAQLQQAETAARWYGQYHFINWLQWKATEMEDSD